MYTYATDIVKTFGPLLDWTTGKHVENTGFTGPSKVLQSDLIFLNIKFPIEGLPPRIFWRDNQTTTIRVSVGPSLILLTEDRWISRCLLRNKSLRVR